VNLFAQIKIDQVGDNWVSQVESAILYLKENDSQKYHLFETYCKKISFWNGNYSSTEGNDVIVISLSDMKLNSIENLSTILVHESKHLEILNNSKVYELEIGDEILGVWGTSILDQKMAKVEVGDEVRIIFNGKKVSEKTKRQYKDFTVQHRKVEVADSIDTSDLPF
jgi:hypothetical protein